MGLHAFVCTIRPYVTKLVRANTEPLLTRSPLPRNKYSKWNFDNAIEICITLSPCFTGVYSISQAYQLAFFLNNAILFGMAFRINAATSGATPNQGNDQLS